MQLCFSQNRSSLKRFHTVPFSTWSTNFASHFLNWMTSGSTMRRQRVAARSHATAVDLVALVDDRDVADHRAAVLGEDVQFFAQRAERDLEVLEDRVATRPACRRCSPSCPRPCACAL
jgi:MoxR-like ATPase